MSSTAVPDELFADDADALAALVERHGDPSRHGARAMVVLSFALDRAHELGASSVIGDIEYRLARHAVERSELEVAMGHLDRARDAFDDAGRHDAAMRTVLGRMHVLDEYGRHADVVALGIATAAQLAGMGDDPAMVWLRGAVAENVGVACGLMGRHSEAMAHYEQARLAYDEVGASDDVARSLANRGCELVDLGRAGEAMAAFDQARAMFVECDERLWVAKVDAHRGQAELARGHLGAAVELLEAARRDLDALDAVAERRRATAVLVATYTELRLIDEARAAADVLVDELRRSQLPHDLGAALVARGRALLVDGRLDAARRDIDEAIALLDEVGDRGGAASAWTVLARIDAAAGDVAGARAAARRAADVALELDREADHLTAATLAAELLVPRDPARALDDARGLRPRGEASGLPLVLARIDYVIGIAAAAVGDDAAAERSLSEAIARVTRLHEALDSDEWRMRFLHDRREMHESFADVLLNAGRAGDALEVLDQPRRLLAGPASEHGSELAASIDALGRASSADRPGLVERVRALEAAARRVDGPERRTAVGGRAPVGRTAVVYRVRDDSVGAFVVAGAATVWVPLCVTTDVRRAVQRLEANWRHRRMLGAAHESRLADELLALLQHLYSAIVEPLLPWLSDEVDVVSDGIVHGVPLAALHDGTEHLVSRLVIRDVGSLMAGPMPPWVQRTSAVAIGTSDHRMPLVDDEVASVAARYAEGIALTGEAATACNLMSAAPGADVVHLAGHGQFRVDNPGRSAVQLADRWLTADELAAAGIHDAVVVVNVCDGGRRDSTVGRVEGAGLPQRLLAGGAAAVIGPRVTLDDRDAAAMAAHIHRHLATGVDPARALHAAQRDALADGLDPSIWGAFAAHVRHRPIHDRRSPDDRPKEPR